MRGKGRVLVWYVPGEGPVPRDINPRRGVFRGGLFRAAKVLEGEAVGAGHQGEAAKVGHQGIANGWGEHKRLGTWIADLSS